MDEVRCRFVVSESVYPAGTRRFSTPAEAAGHSVAESVLSVPGVAEVELADDTVTVVKGANAAWCDLEEPVRYAIATAVAESTAAPTSPAGPVDDDAMYELVAEIFRSEINPAVAQHGGRVELIDVQDATVVLRMQGGCQGCGMANVTLRQGIEASLRRMIPGFKGLADITDHAAGTDPYFSAQKK